MNLCKVLPLVVSVILISGCASLNHAQDSKLEEKLFGKWNCKLDLDVENVKMSFDYDVRYIRNGKSNGFGTLKLNIPDWPEMEYSISDSSNWELKDGYLIEMTEEIKLVNLSHPEFDEVLNLESMFPQNISESSKILVLNDSLLKVKSETEGTVMSCNKIPIKSKHE